MVRELKAELPTLGVDSRVGYSFRGSTEDQQEDMDFLARAMLMAGGTITGREAFEAGLASHLVEREALSSSVLDLATQLRAGGRTAMTSMKNFLNELDGSLDDDVLDRAARVSADVIASDETQVRLRELFGS